MSQTSRAQRRKRKKIRRIITIIILLIIAIIVAIGYYRSQQDLLIKEEDYVDSVNSQLYFIRDCDYLILDDFTQENLAFPDGTKVSGYDILTNSPVVVNQEFLTTQVQTIDQLISSGSYHNWDQYALEMQNAMTQFSFNNENILFYIDSARYSPDTLDKLTEQRQLLSELNTGRSVELKLTLFANSKTGFIFSNISEYDQIACEAVLGSITSTMLEDLNGLKTTETEALRIVNNDHAFALTTVSDDTIIQDLDTVKELKQQYSEGLKNSEYYNMLITRVDRLRLYPEISFDYDGKEYPAYLIDVVEEEDKKILVLMLKEYLAELSTLNKINCEINVQKFSSYILPQSSIIYNEDKTYVEVLRKGYFPQEIEININKIEKGKAILNIDNNPELKAGMTIKVYP